jgi:hypothetical protein
MHVRSSEENGPPCAEAAALEAQRHRHVDEPRDNHSPSLALVGRCRNRSPDGRSRLRRGAEAETTGKVCLFVQTNDDRIVPDHEVADTRVPFCVPVISSCWKPSRVSIPTAFVVEDPGNMSWASRSTPAASVVPQCATGVARPRRPVRPLGERKDASLSRRRKVRALGGCESARRSAQGRWAHSWAIGRGHTIQLLGQQQGFVRVTVMARTGPRSLPPLALTCRSRR